MIPVMQDRFGENGNCLAACVASLLEVPLAAVPDTGGKGWQQPLGMFLLARGLYYVEVPAGPLIRQATDDPPAPEANLGWQPLVYAPRSRTPLVIVIGPSPRGLWNHCVVGETNGYGFRVAHDPHPDRSGIKHMTAIGWFAVDARIYEQDFLERLRKLHDRWEDQQAIDRAAMRSRGLARLQELAEERRRHGD